MISTPSELNPSWWVVLLLMALTGLGAWVGIRVLDAIGRRAAARAPLLQSLRQATRVPALVLGPLLAWAVVLSSAPDPLLGMVAVRRIVTVAIVFSLTWLLIQGVLAMAEMVAILRPSTQADNLAARRLQTQARVLSRVVASVLAVLGVAMALMTFPQVRHVGASLLASAGLAGIVAGLAARPLLGNLIAGLQIGLTQPIRLDDVVIVEGEWGRIEEITGTYVVVAIWDERRLIVPLEWWTQNPFQNWTRNTAQILGSVFLWVDYQVPIETLRAELSRVVKANPLWDGRVCELQATDASERAVQLRCLLSSRNSSDNWHLKCEVRERLIAFLQSQHPVALPRLRVLDVAPEAATDAACHPVADDRRPTL
jgi:small-conductance mechanosensitive channel